MFALPSRFTRLAFAAALFISSGTMYGATAYGQDVSDEVSTGVSEEVGEGTAEDEAGFAAGKGCPVRIWCVTHQRHEIIYVAC